MKSTKHVIILSVLFFRLLMPEAWAADPKGKSVYTTYCMSCHGKTGNGDGPAAQSLSPKPADFKTANYEAKQVYDAATNGVKGTAMVAFPQIPEKDRWAVAHYIVSAFEKPSKKK